jgi:hypothetical protein
MSEFFDGWRRKLGTVTLMMACVLMTGWLRGRFGCDDNASIFVGESTYVGVVLCPYEILFHKFKQFPESNMAPTRETVLLIVPYWSVVNPLTLLSAYLLLSKPRPANKTKTVAN